LAWLAHSQGDAVGLYVFREGQVFSAPARRDPQHLARIYYQLENLKAGGVVGDVIDYRQIFLREQKRELLIFITDYYEHSGEIGRLLELLAALRQEIVVFHVMGRNELERDFGGYTQVEDLETGKRMPVGAFDATEREAYMKRMRAWLASVRMQCLDRQIAYQLMRMDQPMDGALRDFLKRRAAGGGMI
jgi:uncharacterized protein (DUF58 family)